MRTPIVNAIALLAATNVAAFACSSADAHGSATHAKASAAATATATVTATAKAPGSATLLTSAKDQASDSLSKAADVNRTDGSTTSKVWVVEISDLQCPFCKQWHDNVFPKIRDEYVKTGKVRFAYVNFPLSQHKNAFAAAVAAMCGSAQGKFWQMHDGLFTTQDKWENLANPSAHFESLATKAGIDIPQWKACLTSPTIKALIEADRDRAQTAGVQSTPSFIIDNKLIDGAMPLNDMRKAIDAALAAHK